ncbi:phosphatidylinositol kinase [Candidatus Saccharibacteria bacterium]|nr:phosphatidylinositol kinase [Candidatus Saccharibacteria bacterium]
MSTKKTLAVFAHLEGNGFVPAALLDLTETGTLLEKSSLGYGTRYLERKNALEIEPVHLGLKDAREKHIVVQCPNPPILFGGIRDAAPDSWGRRVIEAKLEVQANSLAESDYLIHAGSDRVGALDVRPNRESKEEPSLAGIADLGYLMQAAERIEAGEPVPKSLDLLFNAGSALGGARPKANVRDDDGALWIAKFPSEKDYRGLTEIEAATVFMAGLCNIRAPETKITEVGSKKVMLIRRFDRFAQEGTSGIGRTQFNSALTFLGCADSDNNTKSYTDIADAIKRYAVSSSVRSDQAELFRRMVFNIFVSNDDDHLRNHGFLYDQKLAGWKLSPVYDLMPRPNSTGSKERYLSLGVGDKGRVATIENAISQSQRFGLSEEKALSEINTVWSIVRQWRNHFEGFGLSGKIIDVASTAMRHLSDISSPDLAKKINRSPSSDPSVF